MGTDKNTYNTKLKAILALEAVKGLKTVNEIAKESVHHPTQIQHWKKQLLGGIND